MYFVKRRILEFKYSIFWVSISIAMLILSLNKDFVEKMASAVDIHYAPAFLFLIGIIFILLLIFYFTIVISDMQRKIIRLTQEVGILKSSSKDNK
jgi:hypothetical protein